MPKQRNPYALEAKMRSGGGFHRHPKWAASQKACRGKIEIPEEY